MSPEHAEPPMTSTEHTKSGATQSARVTRATRRGRRYPIYIAAQFLNPIMRNLAGRPRLSLFAVVLHRGRRSGRLYATPVRARPTADGFVIPLTFGEGADWFSNMRAAGGCVIRWKGADYNVVEPEVIDWATARPAFHPAERALIPLIGIERFVRVRHAASDGGNANAIATALRHGGTG